MPLLRSINAYLIFALLTAASLSAQGGGIVISSGGPATAGSTHCVSIMATGHSSGPLHISVELNGVVVSHQATRGKEGDPLSVCFFLPAASAGGELTITVTGDGASNSVSSPVADC
jgi:hypothetical protein